MKAFKKLVCGFAIAAMMVPTLCTAAQAQTVPETDPVTVEASSSEEISPRKDVIVIYTREYHGIMQYRRWNETQNCWVDPDWINFF